MSTDIELAKHFRGLNLGVRVFAVLVLWFVSALAILCALSFSQFERLYDSVFGDKPKPHILEFVENQQVFLSMVSVLLPMVGTVAGLGIKNPRNALFILTGVLAWMMFQLALTVVAYVVPFLALI